MIAQGRFLPFRAFAFLSKSSLEIGLAFLSILSHNLSLSEPLKGL